MGFLSDFVTEIRRELAERPLDHDALRRCRPGCAAVRPFVPALRAGVAADGIALIAEVKRASPSAGAIATDADPVQQAVAYDAAGAAVISVLTEPRHFGGSLDDLRAVRGAVAHPVLRKDFLVHPDQVLEARAAGADTVLLIAACLPGAELAAMLRASRELGMEPLVETHSDEDLRRALATDAEVIGVNARDLESLAVDLARRARAPRAARRRSTDRAGERHPRPRRRSRRRAGGRVCHPGGGVPDARARPRRGRPRAARREGVDDEHRHGPRRARPLRHLRWALRPRGPDPGAGRARRRVGAAARRTPRSAMRLAGLLADFVGRPTPITSAARLSEELGLDVWLKREDLAHTGAHKINNALGQVLVARHLGKERIIAETGAGQHGVATATACALLGFPCVVYMGEEDTHRQAPNVARMQLLGAEVRPGHGGEPHAEGSGERRAARLGRLGAHHPLRDRLGRRAASVPDARARSAAGDRRRGSGAVRGADRRRPALRARVRRRWLERDRHVHRLRRSPRRRADRRGGRRDRLGARSPLLVAHPGRAGHPARGA